MANLHDLLIDIAFEDLPPAWTTFDLASFSRAKSLWDYQQSALQNALKALHKYYQDFGANIEDRLVSSRSESCSQAESAADREDVKTLLEVRVEGARWVGAPLSLALSPVGRGESRVKQV